MYSTVNKVFTMFLNVWKNSLKLIWIREEEIWIEILKNGGDHSMIPMDRSVDKP